LVLELDNRRVMNLILMLVAVDVEGRHPSRTLNAKMQTLNVHVHREPTYSTIYSSCSCLFRFVQ
jgi:hypothetical protein